MSEIVLSGIDKRYGSSQLAVRDLNLDIPDGSFTCLLGPSGCGKTTTLRMIAGLEQPTSGEIRAGERVFDSVSKGVFVPPEDRGIGLVFQSYALWPHMSIARNVDFGLRMKHVPRASRESRVDEVLTMLRIADMKDRLPSQLSGGQQQRVALARMLAINPDVLLLDEPLSNLDAQLRLEMRAELKRIHEEFKNTFVFVTHDQYEAMTLATHIAVMNLGVLQQFDAPLAVYDKPASKFVAEFVGSTPMNMIGSADGSDDDSEFARSLRRFVEARWSDGAASIGVRPEAMRLGAGTADEWNTTGTVRAVMPTGSSWIVTLESGQTPFTVVAFEPVHVSSGAVVACHARADDLHIFDADGRRVTAYDDLVRRDDERVGAER